MTSYTGDEDPGENQILMRRKILIQLNSLFCDGGQMVYTIHPLCLGNLA